MHPSVRAMSIAAVLSSVAAIPAAAADVTPEQARAMEGQIKAWMQNSWIQALVGPTVIVDDRSVQVTPDGERYRMAVPVTEPLPGGSEPGMATALVRLSDGGRWTIDDWRLPPLTTFTGEILASVPRGRPSGNAARPKIPVDYTLLFANQDNRGFYDPSFATPSTLSANFAGMELRARSAAGEQVTKVERAVGTTTLRPDSPDRVDLITDTTLDGYSIGTRVGDTQQLDFTARRMRVGGEITALSREGSWRFLQTAVSVGDAIGKGTRTSTGTLRAIVPLMRDLASAMKLDQVMEGISIKYGPFSGTASQAQIGLSVQANGGMLQADMDLGVDGLAMPDLVLGAMAELLPRRIMLHPVLTGVPVDELIQLLTVDQEAMAGRRPPEVEALLARGTVTAGLESFAVDIGGASFAGMGQVLFKSSRELTGQAQVTAVDFDLLMQRVNSMPELVGALPVFVFAKGIGRAVENRLVWDITYRGGKLMVNGTDLTSMMSGRRR